MHSLAEPVLQGIYAGIALGDYALLGSLNLILKALLPSTLSKGRYSRACRRASSPLAYWFFYFLSKSAHVPLAFDRFSIAGGRLRSTHNSLTYTKSMQAAVHGPFFARRVDLLAEADSGIFRYRRNVKLEFKGGVSRSAFESAGRFGHYQHQ